MTARLASPLPLRFSILAGLVVGGAFVPEAVATPPESVFIERRLATIPEGLSLVGKPSPGPEGPTPAPRSRFVFAPDGSAVAYVAYRGGASVPVIGDRVGKAYAFLSAPVVAARAPAFAFRAGNPAGPKVERWHVVVDGGTLPDEDWIGEPAIGPLGQRVAYWTQPGARIVATGAYARRPMALAMATRGKSGWTVRRTKAWDDATALIPPVFSPDGKKIATIVTKDGREHVLVWDGRGKPKIVSEGFPSVRDLVWDPKSKVVAFVGAQSPPGMTQFRGMGPSEAVVVWGKKRFGEKRTDSASPVIGPRGRRMAYRVVGPRGTGIAVDRRLPKALEAVFVSAPRFSADAKRVAYVRNVGGKLDAFRATLSYAADRVKGGEWSVHVATAKSLRQTWKSEPFLRAADPVLSPKGNRVAFRARTEKGWHVQVDARRTRAYDDVGAPLFDAQGLRVGFGARTKRELWWRVWIPPK